MLLMKARMAVLAALCAALLCSCGPFGSRTASLGKLSKADARAAALLGRVEGFAGLAASMGLKKPAVVSSLVVDSDEGLGFKVTTSADGATMKSSIAWSTAARDRLLAKAAKSGRAASYEPFWHCRPWSDRTSPLPSAALEWSDARLAEWLAWEWAAKAWKPKSDSDAAFRAATYASYKAGQAMLIKTLGPGSRELAQWQEGLWDRRTFQTLAADLKGQAEGIFKANQDPQERETVLRRIVGFWAKDYRANYPKRFIANEYAGFGRDDWVEPTALWAMSWGYLGWKDWEAAFPGPIQDIGDFLKELKK